MNTEQELTKKLGEQLKIEIDAKNLYERFIKKIKDETINKTISQIKDDEIKHIETVNELIRTVEGYKKPIKEELKKEATTLKRAFGKSNAVLLLGNIDEYMHKTLLILKDLAKEKKVIYVSYNKLPKYTKKVMSDHGINIKDMLFVNCVSIQGQEDIAVRPENLTSIALTITEAVKKTKNAAIIVDTISGFTTYHRQDMISQFVASMNDKARSQDYRILWVAIKDESTKALDNRLSQLCDETIKL